MFRYFFGTNEKSPLDSEIEAVLEEMRKIGVNSERYPNMLRYLKKLIEMKRSNKPSRVNPDTIALIVGNLFGILIIIIYEQKHVITTRSFTQLIRPGRQT